MRNVFTAFLMDSHGIMFFIFLTICLFSKSHCLYDSYEWACMGMTGRRFMVLPWLLSPISSCQITSNLPLCDLLICQKNADLQYSIHRMSTTYQCMMYGSLSYFIIIRYLSYIYIYTSRCILRTFPSISSFFIPSQHRPDRRGSTEAQCFSSQDSPWYGAWQMQTPTSSLRVKFAGIWWEKQVFDINQ